MFRAGHEEAFRAIHDRYRTRLFAYARQMLPARQDAEDALQDVFVRAYAGLRASDRELALRAWLYRVAHNRCIDELRRPALAAHECIELRPAIEDPVAQADQRESLRRLIGDIRRLPDQQRSALLMRELGGMSYADVADALGISVPAVKSLLVRARIALVQAIEARDAACSEIRSELMLAHDRRVRPDARARRHMRDCAGCRELRRDLRGVSRQLAALAPALGPLGVLAKLLGIGGGAGSGAAAGGGTAAAGGAVGCTGAAASTGVLASGVGHVATLLAATVVAAGGAVEIQHAIARSGPIRHHPMVRTYSRPDDAATRAMLAPAQAVGLPTTPQADPQRSTASTKASAVIASIASGASGASGTSSRRTPSPVRTSGIGVNDQLASAPPPIGGIPAGMGNPPPAGAPRGTSGNGGSQTGGGGSATGGSPGGGTGCAPTATGCGPSGSQPGSSSGGGTGGGGTKPQGGGGTGPPSTPQQGL